MQLQSGTLLQGGKYRIIRFINSGGFGCTYEAEHVMLENRVAIKEFFVKDFCNRDEVTAHVTVGTQSKRGLVNKLRQKFVDEARAICKLHHPGIVTVSDVFEENGTAYFVMDYIEGRSLSQMVHTDGPLTEGKALYYIRQVADALKYVHEHNRLHLDVKPGNIMVDGAGRAILIDFGASKQYDEQDGENTSTLLGKTPGYAPLEQMGNDVVKFLPSTDIYALGATLYKLLTGVTPLSAHLLASGEVLSPLPGDISDSTRQTIAAAMQVNKNKRPQSVAEFMRMLEGEEDDTVIVVETKPDSQPKRENLSKARLDSRPKEKPIVENAKKRTIENLKTIPKVLFYINCLLSGFAFFYCAIAAIRLFYGLPSSGFEAFGVILFLCSIVGLSLYSNYKKNGIALIILGESLGGICLSLEYGGEELVTSISVFLLLPIALALFTPWKEFS